MLDENLLMISCEVNFQSFIILNLYQVVTLKISGLYFIKYNNNNNKNIVKYT